MKSALSMTLAWAAVLAAAWAASRAAYANDLDAGRDWPTWRGDARRSAFTTVPLPGKFRLRWTRRMEPAAPAWPASQRKIRFDACYDPVVAGKRLFVASMVSDRLTAYDTESGKELWRFYADGPMRFAPLVWRDKVYAVSDDGMLYCLDAATGNMRWSRRGGPDRRMALGNERLISAWPARGAPVLWQERDGGATIYFAAGIWPFMGSFIYALDAATGSVRWENSGSGAAFITQQHSAPAFAGVAPQGYLAADEDLLMVSGGRTVPAGYDRRTGGLLYYEVASRAFGNDAGGYQVGIAGEHFVNGGCLYDLKSGAPVMNLARQAAGQSLAVDQVGDGFMAMRATGLIFCGSSPVEAPPTGDSGRTPQPARKGLPPRYTVTTGVRADRAHFQAGHRVYLSAQGGWIGAVDLPPMERPGVSWETTLEHDVWTMLPGDGRLFVVTVDGVIHCFDDGRQDGAPAAFSPPATNIAAEGTSPGTNGYALVWGLGTNGHERLLELVKNHYVIVVDPDEASTAALRRRLDEDGLYGRRVHVLTGSPETLGFPPYLASRIEVSEAFKPVDREAFLRSLWRTLRPYGGVAEVRGEAAAALTPSLPAWLTNEGGRLEAPEGGAVSRLVRNGALPGSAPWTHENGDAANTVLAKDELVKAPLGLLWFGGPSHEDILPRHGHGPSPQVAGGRLFIEGPHAMRALDVYTGRILWQRELRGLGKFYNTTSHQPGANEIGANYVSLADGVYVIHERRCLRLDPTSGHTAAEFVLPHEEDEEEPQWGYVGIWSNILLAGATPLALTPNPGGPSPALLARNVQYASASERLVALDRHSGEVLWQRRAERLFRHNAIAMGGGRVFCLDSYPKMTRTRLMPKPAGNPPPAPPKLRFPQPGEEEPEEDLLGELEAPKAQPAADPASTPKGQEPPPASGTILALDATTGEVLWQQPNRLHGTWLAYSEDRDIVLEAGSPGYDRAADEMRGRMAAYRGADGALLWATRMNYAGRPMLRGDTIYTDGASFDLATGEPKLHPHPVTGEDVCWQFTRQYGCNTPIAGRHLLLFRSAAAGYYDLNTNAGTGNLGGFKSGCSMNLIPAEGVLSAPDYTRTCTCSYQNQCSLALIHMPDIETWTYQDMGDSVKFVSGDADDEKSAKTKPVIPTQEPPKDQGVLKRKPAQDAPVVRVGVNFGAPGDWRAPDGTLWLEYPHVGGPGPEIVSDLVGKASFFRRNALQVSGPARQVTASGLEGAVGVTLMLKGREERSFTVRLYFLEPAATRAGERTFDVLLQGKPAVTALDIFAEAGGAQRGLIKELRGVHAAQSLLLELRPQAGSTLPPVVGGVEIVLETKPARP